MAVATTFPSRSIAKQPSGSSASRFLQSSSVWFQPGAFIGSTVLGRRASDNRPGAAVTGRRGYNGAQRFSPDHILRLQIFFKLIVAVIRVLIVALIAVEFLASRVAESSYKITLKRELADKARMLSELNDPGWRDSDRAGLDAWPRRRGRD
jgi:hypothetical protein